MQFIYNELTSPAWSKDHRLLERDGYQRLLRFLYEHQSQRIILRDIQREFGEQAVVQRELDRLVDLGVILRKDRSYSFHVPVLTQEVVEHWGETTKRWLQERPGLLDELQAHLEMLKCDGQQTFSEALLVYLLDAEFEKNHPRAPFIWGKLMEESVELPQVLAFSHTLVTERFTFASVGQVSSWSDYFQLTLNELPFQNELYRKIFDKIGDVEPFFFLDMLGKKIVQIQLQDDFKERRYNLWSDALITMGEVVETDKGLHCELPLYKQSEVTKIEKKSGFSKAVQVYEKLLNDFQNDFPEESFALFILKSQLMEKLSADSTLSSHKKWLVLNKE